MSAGGSFNTMFADFGNNNQDAIILTIDISSSDDSAKIVNKYISNGATPKFPIVLTTGNSRALANLFGQPNSGGPTFIMHPDREFVSTSYGLSTMKSNLQNALDDDCQGGETKYKLTVTNGSGSGDYAEKAAVTVTANDPQAGFAFEAWIGDTEYLSSTSTKSTTLTMPAKAVSIEATYRDTTNDNIDTTNAVSVMLYAGWEGGKDEYGSTITVDTTKLSSDTTVSASMSLTTSDEAKNEWAWVKLTAYLSNSLEPVTAMKVIYTSDAAVNMVLDQENLSEAGTSYLYELGASGSLKTELLKPSRFAQPSWHNGKEALDLTKVKSISFAAIKEGGSVDITIDDLILYNYDPTSVIKKVTQKMGTFGLATEGRTFALTVPETGTYVLKIFGVNGRLIHSQKCQLQGGLNRVANPLVNAASMKLITIEGNSQQATFKTR